MVQRLNLRDMALRGKQQARAPKKLLLSVRIIPFVLVGVSIGWLLATVFPPSLLYSSASPPVPARSGVVHDAFSKQGLSHVAFHNGVFKERLARLLRKSGIVAVVGVEYGAEVIELARGGYEVYAFEALKQFVDGLNRILALPVNKGWKVHVTHAAAGDTTGGNIRLSYSNANAVEMVPRARVDDRIPAGTEIDVLSVDIQGNEYDVLKGASKLLGGKNGVRSLWIEIGGCKPKVYQMFDLLERDYIIFDFVPWGLSRDSKQTTPAGIDSAGWIAGRPGGHKQYLDWFCAERKKHFTWLQSDIVAIRKDLATPLLLKKLGTLGNDAFVQYSDEMLRKRTAQQ